MYAVRARYSAAAQENLNLFNISIRLARIFRFFPYLRNIINMPCKANECFNRKDKR